MNSGSLTPQLIVMRRNALWRTTHQKLFKYLRKAHYLGHTVYARALGNFCGDSSITQLYEVYCTALNFPQLGSEEIVWNFSDPMQ